MPLICRTPEGINYSPMWMRLAYKHATLLVGYQKDSWKYDSGLGIQVGAAYIVLWVTHYLLIFPHVAISPLFLLLVRYISLSGYWSELKTWKYFNNFSSIIFYFYHIWRITQLLYTCIIAYVQATISPGGYETPPRWSTDQTLCSTSWPHHDRAIFLKLICVISLHKRSVILMKERLCNTPRVENLEVKYL